MTVLHCLVPPWTVFIFSHRCVLSTNAEEVFSGWVQPGVFEPYADAPGSGVLPPVSCNGHKPRLFEIVVKKIQGRTAGNGIDPVRADGRLDFVFKSVISFIGYLVSPAGADKIVAVKPVGKEQRQLPPAVDIHEVEIAVALGPKIEFDALPCSAFLPAGPQPDIKILINALDLLEKF